VFTSTTLRVVYIDGGSSGSNTQSSNPTGLDTTRFARRVGTSNYLDGRLAEAAVWNTNLSASEVQTLAAGYCPLFVRPEHLEGYFPMWFDEGTTTQDLIGLHILTHNGTPNTAEHPGIIYPCRPQEILEASAAAIPIPTLCLLIAWAAEVFQLEEATALVGIILEDRDSPSSNCFSA